MSFPDNASLTAGREGAQYVRQRNERGYQQRFPDHASYLRYLSGVAYVQSQRRAAPIPFTEPTNVSVITESGVARVAFTAPTSTGGSPIVSYTVVAMPGNITVTGTASPITVPGLQQGQAYTFTVTALNGSNTSSPSTATTPVTVIFAPDAPTDVIATPGNMKATVRFTAPANNGGAAITSYTVSAYNGSTLIKSVSASFSPIEVTGLTNGTAYTFKVVATNNAGDSTPSTASAEVTPVDPSTLVPLAPTSLAISARTTTSLTITFTQASNNTPAVTNYKYSLDGATPVALSPADASSPVTITGLTPKTTYSIQLAAVNANGESPLSDPVSGTTYANIHYTRFLDVGAHTWTAPAGIESVSYLVVGAGGGGGASYSNIEVIGAVPFQATSPGATLFWISSVAGPNYGKLYKGGALYTSSANPFKPVRLSVTGGSNYPIKPTASADFARYKWYEQECVYSISSGLPSIITFVDRGNAIPDAANNISAGGGGGAGGEVKLGSLAVVPGTAYTIAIGAGGAGGTAAALTESVGLPGNDGTFDTVTAKGGSGGNVSRDGGNAPTNGFGKGGTGGFEDGMYFFSGQGGSGLLGNANVINSNYYKYNTADAGYQGRYVDFIEDGVAEVYAAGGPGGIPNIQSAVNAAPNTGNGGSGSGSTLNSFAPGRPGASGLVILKYYTDGNTTASAPTAALTPGDRKLTVTVTPPTSDGGSPITGYKYSLDGGNFQDAPPLSPSNQFDITGLIKTVTYSLRILAVNAQGIGAPSAAVSGTPVGPPDAPTNVHGTPGNKKTIIDFDAPASNGGAEITSYTVSAYSGSTLVTSASGAASPIEVTGLTNGTAYTFKVTATNSVGTSDPSTASAAVTPDSTGRAILRSGNGTWTVPAGVTSIEYLIVGGGGGGGGAWDTAAGAGGGGGMVLTNTISITGGTDITYSVGAGGAAGTSSQISSTVRTATDGGNGSSSTISFGSTTITAEGGGLGYRSRTGNPTADKAGGSAWTSSIASRGGNGSGANGSGGGGGGYTNGTAGNGTTSGGNGGLGFNSSLEDGTTRAYGAGGAGGKGTNADTTATAGTSGAANTGNGGSGARVGVNSHAPGGAGGSGIIVIKYSLP